MNRIYKNFNSSFVILFRNLSYSRKSTINLHNLLSKMAKDEQVVRQRQKIKENSRKYISSTVKLHILGCGAEGTSRALYIFTDHSRYLFNCGEGTQRLAHEHKMKLSRLEHIFVTQAVWSNIGGLPGLALTVQDAGVSDIKLHGPQGLDELFTATQRFVVLKDLQITMDKETEQFEDNVMTVKFIEISKDIKHVDNFCNESKETVDCFVDNTDYYANERKSSIQTKQIIPNELRQQNTIINYICKLRPRPGELSLEKCVEKGIPPGPLLGKLKNGESIQLANGHTVHSHEVCSPNDPGQVFMVIDCPDISYLDSFLSREEWTGYQSTAETDENLASVVFHFTPPDIINDPRYQTWINKFSPSTHHICLNTGNTCLGSAAVYKVQNQLNLIDKDIFPRLPLQQECYNRTTTIDEDATFSKLDINCTSNKTTPDKNCQSENESQSMLIFGKTLWNYSLRPKTGLNTLNEIKNSVDEDIAEVVNMDEFLNELNILKEKKTLIKRQNTNFPSILFLGTGSCIPNKTRNTSGILLRTDDDTYILLDCGEGTFGQMVRFYGKNKIVTILKQIKAIYISHLHADHHIGLVGFLTERRRILTRENISYDPVYLIAPKQIMWWLTTYDKRFESIAQEFRLLPNTDIILNQHNKTDYEQIILNNAKLESIDTAPVKHCPNSFGVAVKTNGGYKITYSGDTMPCDELVKLGQGSNVLIHEATMEDELEEEAKIKMHSTVSQAINIGKQMKAQHIILTHFSQRYARIPRLSNEIDSNVGIAFDNMIVTMDDLQILPLLYPAFKILFREHCEQLENKATKRQARNFRNQEIILQRNKKQKSENNSRDNLKESTSTSVVNL